MRDHTHDVADLDDAAARERAALAASIQAIQDRLAAATLIATSVRAMAQMAKPVGETLARQVQDNPLAAATTAVGLAWLLFGTRDRRADPPVPPLAGTTFEALSRWEDEGGPGLPGDEPAARLAGAATPDRPAAANPPTRPGGGASLWKWGAPLATLAGLALGTFGAILLLRWRQDMRHSRPPS